MTKIITQAFPTERPRAEGGVRPRITVITPAHVRQISCPIIAVPTPIIFWMKENHGRQAAQRTAGEATVSGQEEGKEGKRGCEYRGREGREGGSDRGDWV